MLGRGAGCCWNGFGCPAIPPLRANGLAAGTGLVLVGTLNEKLFIYILNWKETK